jgi:hypothetical protein
MRISSGIAAVAAATFISVAAVAAPVSGLVNFSIPGLGGPTDPLTGSINVSFDTSNTVVDVTLPGGAVVSLNASVASAVGYSYNSAQDILSFGGIAAGVANLDIPNDDFTVEIQNLFGGRGPLLVSAQYNVGADAYVQLFGGTADFEAAAVPEPATMALLGAGLLGLAAVRRRRLAA